MRTKDDTFENGRQAYQKGLRVTDNPYSNTIEHWVWLRGFSEAFKKRNRQKANRKN